MSAPKITVSILVNQSSEKVWNCYNEPQHITKWNFASPDWHCPSAQIDLRAGGKLLSRMEAKDGSFGFDFEATYDEVTPLKKVAYTMTDGRQAVTTFEATNGGTKVTTTFDAETQNSLDMQKEGWQAILDNFKAYTEAN